MLCLFTLPSSYLIAAAGRVRAVKNALVIARELVMFYLFNTVQQFDSLYGLRQTDVVELLSFISIGAKLTEIILKSV